MIQPEKHDPKCQKPSLESLEKGLDLVIARSRSRLGREIKRLGLVKNVEGLCLASDQKSNVSISSRTTRSRLHHWYFVASPIIYMHAVCVLVTIFKVIVVVQVQVMLS